jgi:hypothetical protein
MQPILTAVLATALCAAALPAAALTLGGGGDARPLDLSQTYDFAADPAAGAGTYVATQAEGKLKGVSRVGIVNACVQFVDAKSASGHSAGGTLSYTRTADGSIPGGLDSAQMQAVADQWLDQLEADLRAAGFELVPYRSWRPMTSTGSTRRNSTRASASGARPAGPTRRATPARPPST